MFKGKAIYNPSGKAGEYSYWACNFYNGCSNGCTYCYCKKGVLAHVMGGDVPVLKKCFNDENHALKVFEKELLQNKEKLQKHGLFFSFTTDPMLPETIDLTLDAAGIAIYNSIPVKILTKCTDWVSDFISDSRPQKHEDIKHNSMYAFGFTLTGHDELEPGASTNQERIEAMAKLHDSGFKTFASIEPIIDLQRSLMMIQGTIQFCDLYKIGLMSGQKITPRYYEELRSFNLQVVNMIASRNSYAKVYWKNSFKKSFSQFPDASCNVERDYNIFHEMIK